MNNVPTITFLTNVYHTYSVIVWKNKQTSNTKRNKKLQIRNSPTRYNVKLKYRKFAKEEGDKDIKNYTSTQILKKYLFETAGSKINY